MAPAFFCQFLLGPQHKCGKHGAEARKYRVFFWRLLCCRTLLCRLVL